MIVIAGDYNMLRGYALGSAYPFMSWKGDYCSGLEAKVHSVLVSIRPLSGNSKTYGVRGVSKTWGGLYS